MIGKLLCELGLHRMSPGRRLRRGSPHIVRRCLREDCDHVSYEYDRERGRLNQLLTECEREVATHRAKWPEERPSLSEALGRFWRNQENDNLRRTQK